MWKENVTPKATDAITKVIEKKQQEVREGSILSRLTDAKPHTLRNISHSAGILCKHN